MASTSSSLSLVPHNRKAQVRALRCCFRSFGRPGLHFAACYPQATSSLSRPSFQLQYKFGPWPIAASEVFVRTELSFAFVNLKPLVPGGCGAVWWL